MQCLRFIAAWLALLAAFALPASAQSTWPPAPEVHLALNPLTNKLYLANPSTNSVTVLDAATGTSKSIAVGGGPAFIALNPLTNRVYVNNSRDASLSVIDGATDTLVATYPIGSSGPIALNPATNVVYVVRLTGTGSDEVTYFDASHDTWYTIATNSFQPNALAVNPVTNKLYVTHYATGDVRIISGAFDPAADFPASVSRGLWSHPFAIAVNPVTNRIYAITQDARGPIAVIDGATDDAVFPAVATGHAQGPRAVVVNPVTNKVYAAFANEVIVIDGASNALTYVPISGAGTGAIALGLNTRTNRIYAASASGTLSVIDGDSDTVVSTTSFTVDAGGSGMTIAVNPVTGTAYLFDTVLATHSNPAGESIHAVPLATTITPFASDTTPPSATFTMSAASSFSPASLPVRGVYYQVDSTNGPWTAATGTGPYSGSFSNLTAGSHTLYAFAIDGQDAPLSTGPQSIPLVGGLAAYTFTVDGSSLTPSVSLLSSANPATVGDAVTFTASVAGSSGTPTGSVRFSAGATTLCNAVALSGGTAACTTSTLAAGSHTIEARYSGDGTYEARSSSIGQTISKATARVALSSSRNPSTVGAAVTFTAVVSGGQGTAQGTVAFLDGSAAIGGCGSVALSGGVASCTTSTLDAGNHTLTARYAGSSTYATATSDPLSQAVAKAEPTIALSSSANPSMSGQAVTLTASIGGTAGAVGGTVTFTDGAATLCASVPVSSGIAACNTGALAAGAHPITARYSGDARYDPASRDMTQTVNTPAKAVAVVDIASSPNPSTQGEGVTFTATVSGSAGNPSGTASFLDGGSAIAGCSGLSLSFGAASCQTASLAAGTHSITATYSGDASYNAAASRTLSQSVAPPPPPGADVSIAQGATPNPVAAGQEVVFTLTVGNAGPGAASSVVIADSIPAGATFVSASSGCANASGTVTCSVGALALGATASVQVTLRADAAGTLTNNASVTAAESDPDSANNSSSLAVTVDAAPKARLVNIATRGKVLTGEDVMIGGFIIGGSTPKTVVVRARGPSLSAQGVPGVLANPLLQLFSGQTQIAVNDNWQEAANAAQLQASGFAPADAMESAILVTLSPGAYSAIMTGVGSTTGVGLIEVFELDHPEVPLLNIATRARVLTGDDVMIGGFIIQGDAPQTVVVRARGPSMRAQGVADPLANPVLQLFSGQTQLAVNDNWQDAANASQLQASGFAPADALESALLVTLNPGAYTAIVTGAGGTTGVGIVEVFAQ